MSLDFEGYDVIIRDDDTEETLLMGKVGVHNKEQNMIELDAQPMQELEQRHMLVLLFKDGQAYTYHGSYRRLLGNNPIGIALYRGEVKQDRKNERFAINIGANIIEHKAEDGEVLYNKRTQFNIMDISRSGVRIQGQDLHLRIKDKIQIRFILHSKIMEYYARIVRVGEQDETGILIEYGCELLTKAEYDKVIPTTGKGEKE